ncbi:MAG: rod shape-determining protein MreD, partial [Burkholderiales bacterium]|nr:rod shape-determining protein MreD [Burkholderiales bacterium]
MRPEYLLLPASRAFIAFTILVAFVLNIMPWGRMYGVPDFLAIVLVFWNIHQPRKVGIGIAFLVGLLMDVHASALLGERALAYSLLSYGAMSMHRRVPWYRLGGQMLHVLPLFLLAQLVVVAVRMAVGGAPWEEAPKA